MKPLNNNVLIKPSEEENITKSGLIIAKNDKETPQKGEIIAKGENVESKINKGDIVYFRKYSGTQVEEFVVVEEKDILLVLDKKIKSDKV